MIYMNGYALNEFSDAQSNEIRKGLDKGLDVCWHDNPEFNPAQMREIRLGLERGLDVTIYAKPEFNWKQMREIRWGLDKGLDVSVYAKPEFNWIQMSDIREGLERGLDVTIYAKPEFNWMQMGEIRGGLDKGLDVSVYAKPEFDENQMYEIRKGLEKGLDVSVYAKPEFSNIQMREIRQGLQEDILDKQRNIAVLGGTSSVPTEEIVKNYLEVRKDIIQRIKEKCIMKMNIVVAKRLKNPNESYDLDYSEIVNKDEKEAIDLGIQLLDDIVLTGLDMRRVKFPNYVMQYEVLRWDKWTKEDIHKIIMGSWKLPSLTILGNLESGNYSLLDSSSLYSNHMVDDNILVNFGGYMLYIDNLNEFEDACASSDVIERRVVLTLNSLSEDILDKQRDIAVLGGTLSVPTEEEEAVLMDTMEESIAEQKDIAVLGGTLSVPTEEEEAVLMETMEESIAERLSMSEEERNIFDSIPEATRRLYGKMPKEIVANYLKEHGDI